MIEEFCQKGWDAAQFQMYLNGVENVTGLTLSVEIVSAAAGHDQATVIIATTPLN